MKNRYALPFLFLASPATAQISILSTDMPVIGDVLTDHIDTVPTTGQGPSGAGQTWDFGDATESFQQSQDVVDPATTPYAANYPNADLAMTPDGANYVFYTNSGSTMEVIGATGDPLGLGTIFDAPFAPALTLHQFPRTWMSSFDDGYGIDVTADGSDFGVYQVRYTEHGVTHDTTDSYGQITTPVGTYDCLRAHTRTITQDSIWAKIFSFTPWTLIIATSDTVEDYSWYAKETKMAVANLTLDSLGGPARFTWSGLPPLNTSIGGGPATNDAPLLYPQPAMDEVSIGGMIERGSYIILDADGRTVASGAVDPGARVVPLAHLPSGTYTLQLSNGHGPVWSGRLVRTSTR